jgi:hypothetical protein
MQWVTGVVAAVALAGTLQVPALPLGQLGGETRAGLFFHSVDNKTIDQYGRGNLFDFSHFGDVKTERLGAPVDVGPIAAGAVVRPQLGANLNSAGLESQAYVGLAWRWHLGASPVFVEGSFGGTVHDGDVSHAVKPRRNLGCSPMFRESISLGVDILPNVSLMLTVEHSSNASLCKANRGLTNVGLQVAWR